MWIKRFLTSLALLVMMSGAAEAYSQRVFLSGGALIAEDTDVSDLGGTNPAFSGGLMVDYADYSRVRAALTYQEVLSLEAMVHLHPLGVDSKINPYAFAGYGRYFSRAVSNERGMIPLGLGLEYGVNNALGIMVEVGGRWGLSDPENTRFDDTPEVIAGLMPSIGVSYKLERIERQPPGQTPVEDQERREPRESEFAAAENQFPGRNPGEAVQSPFRDPTDLSSSNAPSQFELPYARDSLKQAEPLVIRKGEPTPYEDPGVPPISGEVTLSENGDMVRLPDGTFIMGLTDEDPFDIQNAGRKRVTVSSFYIDRFEITNSEYREWLNTLNESEREPQLPDSTAWRESASRADWATYFYGSTYDDYPVVAVGWEQSRDYCEWDGKRLPTEAEWEYAARAGRVGGIYPWAGFSPQDAYGRFLANYNPGRQGQAADGYAFTAPVGSYPPSRWGLHDMAGNVAEWVEDDYTPTYSQLSDLDPVYTDEEETRKVVRGGSWSSNAFRIGVGFRDFQEMDEPTPRIGFRCAADISQVEGTRRSFGPPQQQQGGQPGQQPPGGQTGQQPPQQGAPPTQGQPPQNGQTGQQPPTQGQPAQGQPAQGQPPQGDQTGQQPQQPPQGGGQQDGGPGGR